MHTSPRRRSRVTRWSSRQKRAWWRATHTASLPWRASALRRACSPSWAARNWAWCDSATPGGRASGRGHSVTSKGHFFFCFVCFDFFKTLLPYFFYIFDHLKIIIFFAYRKIGIIPKLTENLEPNTNGITQYSATTNTAHTGTCTLIGKVRRCRTHNVGSIRILPGFTLRNKNKVFAIFICFKKGNCSRKL